MYTVRANHESKNYILADNILLFLGEVASRIDNENLFSSGSTSHRITVDNLPDNAVIYIQSFF